MTSAVRLSFLIYFQSNELAEGHFQSIPSESSHSVSAVVCFKCHTPLSAPQALRATNPTALFWAFTVSPGHVMKKQWKKNPPDIYK